MAKRVTRREIERAIVKAVSRSTHKRYMTGCIIVKNGEIVSDGCAHASNFRLNELHSIHAEIHALGRARHIDLTGGIAYISTIARKSRNLVMSAPCLTCAIALKGAGINEVIYTDPDGYMSLNLDDDLSFLKVYPRRK